MSKQTIFIGNGSFLLFQHVGQHIVQHGVLVDDVGMEEMCIRDSLLHNKAYDAKGECAIPGDMADEVEALRAELMEAAAGADEELMEKFFETMELSAEDMAKGLQIGVREGSVCPVLCGLTLIDI